MADVTDIQARFKGLAEARQPWESTWDDLLDYCLPRRSGAGKGRSGTELIFDSTPLHALELLAASLGGMLTNPAMIWFDIRVKDRGRGDDAENRAFLAEARERMAAVFNREATGFQSAVHELYLDVALLGTAVMYVEADPKDVVRFSARPLAQCCIAEGTGGRVDTVMRTYTLPALRVTEEWPKTCPAKVRELAGKEAEKPVAILHAVRPRPGGRSGEVGAAHFPWESVYIEQESGEVLEESGYLEMPYMVPRWSKSAGEIYGRGPGLTALSDIRVLNAMARTALMAAEKMADPPLMVPDDGFLGPVRSGPGGLSYYRAGTSDRIQPLPVTVDLAATAQMMEERRNSIRRIFMLDQLQPEGPAVSATEAVIRQSEKMRVVGPVLGRLQTEFLSPLIHRVFRILLRAGELPRFPEGLEPGDIEVDYSSPVTQAQKLYQAQGLSRTLEYLAPLIGKNDPFGVMDNFDVDRAARHVAELFSVPTDYLRSVRDVEKNREQRAKTQQEQASLDQAERAADLAKTAGEVKTGEGRNALQDIMGG